MLPLSYPMPELKIVCLLLTVLCSPLSCRSRDGSRPLRPIYTTDAARSDAASQHSLERANLKTLSKGISAIARSAGAAVVMISMERTLPFSSLDPMEGLEFYHHKNRGPASPRIATGMGSGFLIDLDAGLIVTNNHVIDGADALHLKLANGKSFDGKILARDTRTDIAVLKIKDNKFDRDGLKALSFGKSSDLEPGEFVLALGAPFGLEASVSFGIVSAMNRGNLNITELGDFIQTDAAINPGNSGGPLLNIEGQVVGISTAIYSQSGVYNGIGFAIPSNLVHHVVSKLIQSGRVERGYLGVRLRPANPLQNPFEPVPFDSQGAVIAMVTNRSPAEAAGIKAGDVIIAINDRHVGNSLDLSNSIGILPPGSEVTLELRRGKERKKVLLRLEPFPEPQPRPEALSGR